MSALRAKPSHTPQTLTVSRFFFIIIIKPNTRVILSSWFYHSEVSSKLLTCSSSIAPFQGWNVDDEVTAGNYHSEPNHLGEIYVLKIMGSYHNLSLMISDTVRIKKLKADNQNARKWFTCCGWFFRKIDSLYDTASHYSQKFSISVSKTPVVDVKGLDHRLRRFITCERR